jgi:formylglycine-generating enzyme required for sulfatase activity
MVRIPPFPMARFATLLLVGLACLLPFPGKGAPAATALHDSETLAGPAEGKSVEEWARAMRAWREAERARISYDGREYARHQLLWTQRSFVQPQAMVEDRYLYDPASGRYTVDRYLDDLEKRYGGIDSVLLWAIYPNIGIDARNQHDMLRAMPGGLAGLRTMVEDFHRRGVRVLFPAMPWDAGTRAEGMGLAEATARILAEVGADGVNGDTMFGFGHEYRRASDETGHILAFETENSISDMRLLEWTTMSWGYWAHQPVPEVSRYKWLEPRHMVHISERFARNRTAGLQAAFFNGVGYESWENVWGIWNGISSRDAHALRRIGAIERAMADLLVSPDWQPHAAHPEGGVFASLFPLKGRRLWLLVNRDEGDLDEVALRIPAHAGERYFDLWNGGEIPAVAEGGVALLRFPMEGHGYGAVLALAEGEVSPELQNLLRFSAGEARIPLSSLDASWHPLPQRMVEIPATRPAREAPEGMIPVPAAKFRFQVSAVAIEGDDEPGVDVQFPWEPLPRRNHDQLLDVHSFYIDRTPVTNAQFALFLAATQYQPRDDYNFLRDWKDGAPRPGWEGKPVTWVSLEDARAYAQWAGKRLPHSWEWQYAAQGLDGRIYPWGVGEDDAAAPQGDRDETWPDDVDAHPRGASPFGALDMVGNVWQWTDEFEDEHTRSAVLRGGSYYRAKGSDWYFPQNRRLGEQARLLLLSPGKDRAATLGFRCVVDAE